MSSTAKKNDIDIELIIQEIKEKVRKEASGNNYTRSGFKGREADFNQSDNFKAGDILNSEELRELNLTYTYGSRIDPSAISTHRKGILGRCILFIKRRLFRMVWDGLLKPYIDREREYQANLVRLLNKTIQYIDERDGKIFWEIIRKIDYDVTKVLDKLNRVAEDLNGELISKDKAVRDDLYRDLNTLKDAITDLGAQLNNLKVEFKGVDSAVKGLESILAKIDFKEGSYKARELKTNVQPDNNSQRSYFNHRYLMLENRFRGNEDEIKKRQKIYLQYLTSLQQEVYEIGCGRGEFLQLLKENNIRGRGVDIDSAMVQRAKEKGLKVSMGDGIHLLSKEEDNSLGAIVAFQVVEHLTANDIETLIELSYNKLVTGGKLIFETINPLSLLALSSNYFRDPTHIQPVHPETLDYLFSLSGFNTIALEKISPFPEEIKLKEIKIKNYFTPDWRETTEAINQTINSLNDIIFDYQDYYIVGEKV